MEDLGITALKLIGLWLAIAVVLPLLFRLVLTTILDAVWPEDEA